MFYSFICSLISFAISGYNSSKFSSLLASNIFVIDSNLKLKLKYKVFNNVAPTVIVNNLLEKKTKNLTYLKIKKEDAIITLLTYLAQKNIMSIIIEGGAETINRFIELNFWNEARVILSNQVYQSGLKAPTINKRYSKLQTLNKDTIITYLND